MKARNIVILLATLNLVACSGGKGGGSARQAPPTKTNGVGQPVPGKPGQTPAATEAQKALDKEAERARAERAGTPVPETATSTAGVTKYEPRMVGRDQAGSSAAVGAATSAELGTYRSSGQTAAVSTLKDLNLSTESYERIYGSARRNEVGTVAVSGISGAIAPANSGSAQTTPVVVTGDSLNEVGPGLPRTYQRSEVPIATGAVDIRGHLFTDNHDDSIMAVLVERMKSQPEAQRTLSLELAGAVSNVELVVQDTSVNAKVQFEFKDSRIDLVFSGILQAQRSAALQLISNNSEYAFRGQVTCADQGSLCRNAILTIEQLQDGQVCRRIYIVHRWTRNGVGNGHFTIGDQEYAQSRKIYFEDKEIRRAKASGKEYSGELVIKNKALRGFVRLIGNTAHQTKMDLGEIAQEASRTPRLGYLGVRSWAVASGMSYVEIGMGKQNLYNRGMGIVKFSGLLTKPTPAGLSSEKVEVSGQFTDPVDDRYTSEQFFALFKSAQIIDNDGRGNLTLEIQTYAEDQDVVQGKIRVNFTTLREKVLDFNQLNQVIP